MNTCLPGVGLRPTHYPYLEKKPALKVKWFEAISENYMDSWGRPREMLHLIRQDYPVALHGVSMSLASSDGVKKDYLLKLKELVDEIDPFIVSDHLCWTGEDKQNIHDLLPFPLNKESLQVISDNVNRTQDILKRNILVENVSTYMQFKNSDIPEWEFLSQLAQKTGCKLLLDINNIYVSATNHHFDPIIYLDNIKPEIVGEIHLAGFTDMGDFLFDTHSKPVYPEVWELFSHYIKKAPNIPFMMEWDEDIPEFTRVEEEVIKAMDIWDTHHKTEKGNHDKTF